MIEKINNYEINILNKGLLIGTDSLELISFVKDKINEVGSLLDIGSGSGIIPFSLVDISYIEKIYAVEIQKELANNLIKNVMDNNLERKIEVVNDDIVSFNKKVKYIVSNPPYYPINSGKLPEDESKLIAKFEKMMNMDILFKKVSQLLENNGKFFVIYPLNRNEDLKKYAFKYHLKEVDEKIVGIKKKYIIKEYINEIDSGTR